MYQTPFSDRIRNEAKVPTMTVGNITSAPGEYHFDRARADLCRACPLRHWHRDIRRDGGDEGWSGSRPGFKMVFTCRRW